MCDDLKFLIDVVKGASLLITDEFEVKAKDEKGDLVTNFDYEIEKYIIDKIQEKYPNFSIISEEYNSDKQLSENCFTIDPIDGTINFANNIPLWAIQIACIKNKKTCAAVIYLPKLDEMYYADENGAFLNDKPISVNNTKYDKGLYSIEGPKKYLLNKKIISTNRNVRIFWSCAVSFAWLASGKISAVDVTADPVNIKLDKIWDYLPGQYIAQKAGALIYNTDKMHIAANSKEFLELLKENSPL